MEYLSTYLSFLISLIFIIALCSTLLSIFYELFAYYFKHRSKFLKNAIAEILNDTLPDGKMNLTELLYNHPQIDLTKKTYRHLPSYISSKNFAQTLINALCNKYLRDNTSISNLPLETASIKISKEISWENKIVVFRKAVESLGYSDLQLLLKGFINSSEDSIEKLEQNIAEWFDEYMNRVSGWYKISVQKKLLIIGIVVCVCFNIDFFRISKSLLVDKALTESIANVAAQYTPPETVQQITTPEEFAKQVEAKNAILDTLYTLNAPIFWYNANSASFKDEVTFKKIFGWLIMACLMSLGGPFWFDALSKLVNLRKTGIKPDAISKEKLP